ncbi:MAG: guanylate kinase [Desulfobacterales bacterium]|nr:MAG: guanylate kinase [Desulfobacterales bacterium]
MKTESTGLLLVVSAPSGAGKSTLLGRLMARRPCIRFSVSHTTRPPRAGERDGREYFFVNTERFERGIKNREWAEWALVHGNYYGTSARQLGQHMERGEVVALDIDVQGAVQIRKRFPDAVTVFIMPPSRKELRRRLLMRGADDPASIERRLKNAEGEIARRHEYRHILVNDDLETALAEFQSIMDSHIRAAGKGPVPPFGRHCAAS